MEREFDPGYHRRPYRRLVTDYPDEAAYPIEAFRVEWGPVFHRGRLDGTARVLVIGQDPAAHEAIVRRILVGEAGQRAQGLLARLGIDRSYVFINTFLYSVYGSRVPSASTTTPWRRTATSGSTPSSATSRSKRSSRSASSPDTAYELWRATPNGSASTVVHANGRHPTYPESASRSGTITKPDAFAELCRSWNAVLDALQPVVTPDAPAPGTRYGSTITRDDLRRDPERASAARSAAVDGCARCAGRCDRAPRSR